MSDDLAPEYAAYVDGQERLKYREMFTRMRDSGVAPKVPDASRARQQHNMQSQGRAPMQMRGEGFGAFAEDKGQRFARGAARSVSDVGRGVALAQMGAAASRQEGADDAAAALAAEIATLEGELSAGIVEGQPISDDARAWMQRTLDEKRIRLETMTTTSEADKRRLEGGAAALPDWQAGNALDAAVESAVGAPDPARDDAFMSKVAEGAGGVAGMIGGSVVFGPWAGALQGAAMGAAGQYQDAIANGADEATALQAAGFGFLIGTTDILPLMRAFKPLGKVAPHIAERVTGALAQRLVQLSHKVGRAAAEEALQEGLQTTLENMVAQGLYDPDRGTFEGAGEAALVGALLGGGLGAAGGVRSPTGGTVQVPGSDAASFVPKPEGVAQSDMDALLGDPDGDLTVQADSAETAASTMQERAQQSLQYNTARASIEAEIARLEGEIQQLSATATAGDTLVDRIIGVESGGDPKAKNPRSSARGLGQFIDSTWLSMIKKHRPAVALGKTDAEILGLKTDPDLSRAMVAEYARENAIALKRAGFEATDGNLYLAHFAGAGGAVAILRANGDADIASVLGASTVKANPFLKGKTAAWVMQWADGKVGDKRAARQRMGTLRARQGRLTDALAQNVAASSNETQATAQRAVDNLNAASQRVVLEDVSTIVDRILAKPDSDKDIDAALKVLQSKSPQVGPNRPIRNLIVEAGGIDPKGQVASALRLRGIRDPGLFRKRDAANALGGNEIDNIPASEHPLTITHPELVDPDTGYIDPDALVQALEAERGGKRYLTPDETRQQQALDDVRALVDDLGLDLDGITSADVLAAMRKAQETLDGLTRIDQTPPAEINPLDVSPDLQEDVTGHLDAPPPSDAEVGTDGRPGSQIYINHARIQSGEDIRQLIQQMADADAAAIDQKRRGRVSNAQTISEAHAEYKSLEDLLGRAPGPMSAAQAVAARRLLVSSGEQLMVLAKKAAKDGATEATLAAYRRATAVHYAIQREVLAARAEVARALQSWAIPAGSNKMRLEQIREMVRAEGGTENIKNVAKMMAALDDNPVGLNYLARKSMQPRFWSAMYEMWINGLLSSVKTHVVNITSNAMTAVWSIPERALAAGISHAIYGGEVKFQEPAALAYGMVHGIQDGLHLAFGTSRANEKLQQDLGFASKLEPGEGRIRHFAAEAFALDGNSAIGHGINALGMAINVPGNLLGREDMFFKAVGYRMEVRALAWRTVIAEGLDGDAAQRRMAEIVRDPPESIKMQALDAAHYQTFTNELGEWGRKFQELRATVPGVAVVVPFVRTPVNIMKFTLQRTPVALAAASIRADIAAGGARGATALARMGLGTMVLMAATNLVAQGLVTGGGPEDRELKRIWLDQGNMPYSVRLGDRWFQFSRLDPIGMMIGMGADIGEIIHDLNDDDADELVLAGVVALKDNMLSKTYMSGVQDFMAAIMSTDPTADLGTYTQDMAGTLMPFSAFMRHTAQAVDPVIRDTRGDASEDATFGTWWDGLVNKLKSQVPGMSSELPPRRDVWGEVITRQSGLGKAYDFIAPITSKAAEDDPVNAAMLANRVDVGAPQRVIDGVKLSPDEYSEFSRLAGERARKMLEQVVLTPFFKRMPDAPGSVKTEIMRSIMISARKAASAEMLQKFPALRRRVVDARQEQARQMLGK